MLIQSSQKPGQMLEASYEESKKSVYNNTKQYDWFHFLLPRRGRIHLTVATYPSVPVCIRPTVCLSATVWLKSLCLLLWLFLYVPSTPYRRIKRNEHISISSFKWHYEALVMYVIRLRWNRILSLSFTIIQSSMVKELPEIISSI
jgi:hypothetical protein